MQFGSGEKTKQETLREAFSLLLFSSAQNSDPSGARFFSETLEKTHKIAKGVAHFQRIYNDFEMFLTKTVRTESSLKGVIEDLCEKRVRNHLIFIFSDSLELPKESYFRSLAEQNDCIFIHIFDTFENTLEGKSYHIR